MADRAAGDALWVALAVALLAAVCVLASREASRPLDAGGLAIPAMFSLWSLLVTYHNGNNLILMLPAFAFLWFDSGQPRPAASWAAIAVLQASLMYDVPVRLAGAVLTPGWTGIAIAHFDRVLVTAILTYVAARWIRLTAPAARGAPRPR